MPVISALGAPPPMPDAPSSRPGEHRDAFAPVLAARLASGDRAPPTGNAVPRTGKRAPEVEPCAVAPTPTEPNATEHEAREGEVDREHDPVDPAAVASPIVPPIVPVPTIAALAVAEPDLAPSASGRPTLTPLAPPAGSPSVETTPPASTDTALDAAMADVAAMPAPTPVAGPTASSRFLAPPSTSTDGSADPLPAPAAVPPVAVVPPDPGSVLPALQAFAAARQRTVVDERRPVVRDADAPAAFASLAGPVPTAPVAEPAPLDTTQPRWPEAMMARIEQIRDAQNGADTRIRLHPDALGAIDVALRREGGAVHVRFHAAETATRALLADAQPRLAELADARGLKLAGHASDSNGRHERRQPEAPSQPTRPASAQSAPIEPDTDTRLA